MRQMRYLLATLTAAVLIILASAPAQAQRIVGALSNNEISITSSFAGETLTLFGNVEPVAGDEGSTVKGPFDVIVVITGPAMDRVARRKTNQFGIWLNTEEITFRHFPSFKWVLASSDPAAIADAAVLEDKHILLDSFDENVVAEGDGNEALFRGELVRLMTEAGLFGVDANGILFRSNTLFSGKLSLPGDVPNGTFLAKTYLFERGELIAEKADAFSVRTTGFERFIGNTAHDMPLLYGLACMLLALGTGWLGGVVFRR